jgi:hypothetical protein
MALPLTLVAGGGAAPWICWNELTQMSNAYIPQDLMLVFGNCTVQLSTAFFALSCCLAVAPYRFYASQPLSQRLPSMAYALL